MTKLFDKVEFQLNSSPEIKIKGEVISDNLDDNFYIELMHITGRTQESQHLSLPRIKLYDIMNLGF